MKRLVAITAAATVLVGACCSPTASDDPGFLVATVRGAVELDHQGNALFGDEDSPWGGDAFMIESLGYGAVQGNTLTFNGADRQRPGRGTYSIAYAGSEFRAMYRIADADAAGTEEIWIAEAGTLTISRSSDSLLEGAFAMEAYLACVRDAGSWRPPADDCALDVVPPAEAPRITIQGSFAAIPSRSGYGRDMR